MEPIVNAELMVAEVRSETLEQLLTSIRSNLAPDIAKPLVPDTSLFFDAFPHSLNRGDVLEIQGPTCSGKTHLLYHLLIQCIIPTEFSSVRLGGWGKAAIILDSDSKFDIRRFHQVLCGRLKRLIPVDNPQRDSSPFGTLEVSPIDDLASQCLLRLHIFRPTSSSQLGATLLQLPAYHYSKMPNSEVALLAIDSISAFYWQDRFTMEQLRGAGEQSGPAPSSTSPGPLMNMLDALQKFRVSHAPAIVTTNWALNPVSKPSTSGDTSSPFYKQHLFPFPSPFSHQNSYSHSSAIDSNDVRLSRASLHDRPTSSPSIRIDSAIESLRESEGLAITLHITLPAVHIPSFPAKFTLTEAQEQEAKYRSKVVHSGEVQGLIRTPGSVTIQKFSFWIGEDEIIIDPDHAP